MEPIVESGMTFGPYQDGHCFHIEKSATYATIQDGVQMAELCLLKTHLNSPPLIWIVEAKQSSPRAEAQPNFNEYIGEIRAKLANALALCAASILRRHPTAAAELPETFKTVDLATTGFRLVLVINGHHESWLPPLQDALRSACTLP